MAIVKLKASDRQDLLRKVNTILKKQYGGSVPKADRNVLETMLFACCLEDSPYEDAEAAFQNLIASFHDLNEIRVSSISEVERCLESVDDAAWRAFRARDILQYVFEEYYVFDFEVLRRKTLEAAEKQLAKIKGLTPFVRLYTLQQSLGAHVIPMDDTMCRVVAWMGLIEPDTPPDEAAEEMKTSIRKSDVPLLCHLLRRLGTDPDYKSSFKITKSMLTDGRVDPGDLPDRLAAVLSHPRKRSPAATRTRKKPAARRKTDAAQKSRGTKKSSDGKPVTKKVARPKHPAKKKAARRSVRKK